MEDDVTAEGAHASTSGIKVEFSSTSLSVNWRSYMPPLPFLAVAST